MAGRDRRKSSEQASAWASRLRRCRTPRPDALHPRRRGLRQPRLDLRAEVRRPARPRPLRRPRPDAAQPQQQAAGVAVPRDRRGAPRGPSGTRRSSTARSSASTSPGRRASASSSSGSTSTTPARSAGGWRRTRPTSTLFDVLYLDRFDVTRLPLSRRQELLREAVAWSDRIRLTDSVPGHGDRGLATGLRGGAKRGSSASGSTASTSRAGATPG